MNDNHISKLNKNNSRANIEYKINILKKWSNEGIPIKLDEDGNQIRDKKGEVEFEWVPTSVLDFSKWNGTQNTLKCIEKIGEFKKVSRETLNKSYNSDLNSQVKQILKLIKAKLRQQIEQSDKLGLIQNLENELNYLKALSATMATDIAQLRNELKNKEAKFNKLQLAFESNKVESQRLIKNKDNEIKSLLTSLSKISKLKPISKQ